MAWISNTSDTRWKVTANLCGLSLLPARFQHLHTAYQLILERIDTETPLKQILGQKNNPSTLRAFATHLAENAHYVHFKTTSNFQPTMRDALARFLRSELSHTVHTESLTSHLTAIIPIKSRKAPGLLLADASLSTQLSAQGRLLQYRRGVFMQNYTCVCGLEIRFRRGHEDCPALAHLVRLSRPDQEQKQEMKKELSLTGTKFTNIDFLLNSGQLQRASSILARDSGAVRAGL
jgi:hypothetical protein